MKKIICAMAAIGLLSACAEEPEVADDELVADTEVNDTAMATETTVVAWDTNNDAQFQQDEYNTFGDNFTTWDTDASGTLTSEEFNAGWTQAGWSNPEGAFTAFDDNNDSMLAEDEFFGEDEWTEWDANNDGVLDENEWTF